ncbi:MAG: OmpH family outer membrane protein [Bacteroidales bacterium]|nr:OmpH family outer membrane protein [Bacteroidales bacterium]
MKQVSLILNIVLVIAVAALYVLFFTTKKAPVAESSSVQSVQSGDIVYIRIDSLVNAYDMYNDLKTELEGKVAAIENDLNKKGRAFENDAKSFQDKMQKGLLTRSQAETMNNELMQRQQSLQELSQQKQLEIAEQENVMLNTIMDAVTSYVKEYNKTHGYSLILTTSTASNTIIDGAAGIDITEAILNGLNQEYIKNRGK